MLNLYSYFEGVDDEIKARGNRIDQAGKIAKQAREDELYKTLLPLTQSNTELGLATNKLALGENGLNLQRQGENIANFHANADLRAQNQQLLRQTEAYRQKLGLADVAARNAVSGTTIEGNAITKANEAVSAKAKAESNTVLMSPLNDPTVMAQVAQTAAVNPDSAVEYLRGLQVNVTRTPDKTGFILNGQTFSSPEFISLINSPRDFSNKAVDSYHKIQQTDAKYADGTPATATPQPVGTVTRNILNPTQATTQPAKSTVANPQAVQAKLKEAGVTNGDTAKLSGTTAPASDEAALGKELDSLIASYNLLQSKGQITPDIVESMKTKRADLLNRIGIARKQQPTNAANQDEIAKAKAIILGR